jgi:hypothetical protein
MIHTIKYFYIPNREDYNVFSKVMLPVRANKYINFHKEEYGFKINYSGERRLIHILFTPSKLLNKDIITNNDYTDFIIEANKKLIKYLPNVRIEDLELSQVHYKLDIHTKYTQEYINLISKMKTNYYKGKTDIYYNKYNSKIIDSVYFKCSGYNLNLYIKERESPNNPNFKDVLRLELQLKRPKLRQIKDSSYIDSKLINYFSESRRKYFFENILKDFIYSGDYYSTRRSASILKKHYPNKPAIIDKLIDFQKLIGKHGISKAIELIEKCKQTTTEYLKLLQEAGVNPIPLDGSKVSYLPSLFKDLDINYYNSLYLRELNIIKNIITNTEEKQKCLI